MTWMNWIMVVALAVQAAALVVTMVSTARMFKQARAKLQEADEILNAVKKMALVVNDFNTGQLLKFPTGQHGKTIN